MLKYLKKYWFFCLLAPLFMIGEVAMDLIQPDMMADIVDNGVLGGNVDLIISVGIKMILTVIVGGLAGVLCGVFANLAAQSFGNDLRKDVFSKIMHLSFQQTDKITTGSLVTRLTNDVTQGAADGYDGCPRIGAKFHYVSWRYFYALPSVSEIRSGSRLWSAFCGGCGILLPEKDDPAVCSGAEKAGQH